MRRAGLHWIRGEPEEIVERLSVASRRPLRLESANLGRRQLPGQRRLLAFEREREPPDFHLFAAPQPLQEAKLALGAFALARDPYVQQCLERADQLVQPAAILRLCFALVGGRSNLDERDGLAAVSSRASGHRRVEPPHRQRHAGVVGIPAVAEVERPLWRRRWRGARDRRDVRKRRRHTRRSCECDVAVGIEALERAGIPW